MKVKNLLVLLGLVSAIFTSHAPTPVVAQVTPTREVTNAHDYSVQWTNDDFGDYYKSIDFSSYSTIKSQLQRLNSSKRTKTVGYGNMPSKFYQTDYDPKDKSKIIGFYTKNSAVYSGNMNREHVWPNSRGGGSIESDIHVIRPTFTKDNSSRGNSFYVEGLKTSQSGWDPYAAGMLEQSRGYAARIIFYSCIANSNLNLVDTNNITSGSSGYTNTMGKLSDLLRWNLQYAVDVTELNRNNGAEDLQGNRNPFIDNPYLACAIWGNYNANTRAICAEYDVIVDPYTGDITLPDNTGGDTGDDPLPSVNWGSLSSPITTAQAVENMKNFSDKQTSDSSGYVKGIVTEVTEISSQYKNVTLTLDNKLFVFRAKTPNNTYDSSNPEVKVGDEIVVTGTFQKYGAKDEIINGSIVSVKDGSTITPDNPGSGTETPDNPGGNTPSNPGGGAVVENEEISFDFVDQGLENCTYMSEVTVEIDDLEYYFSDIFVGAQSNTQVVRLGKKGSNAIQDLGLSGQGSYLEPLYDIENCSSIELEITATYSNTTGYAILFRDQTTGNYEVLKESGLSGATTLSYKLSEPRNGNFVIAIKGSQARADLGQLIIKSEGVKIDLSGLKLEASTYVKDETSYLQFEADFDKNYFTGSTKFGVLVFSKNQLGSSNISDLYTEGNLSSFKSSISKYTILDFDFTNDKIESNGKYLYGCAITNVSGHEDYQFVAVSYIEISGKLYFTTEITASVNSCK